MFDGIRGIFSGPSYDQSKDEAELKMKRAQNAESNAIGQQAHLAGLEQLAQNGLAPVNPSKAQEVGVEALGIVPPTAQVLETGKITVESIKQEVEDAGDDIKIIPESESANSAEASLSVAQSVNGAVSSVSRAETDEFPEIK